MSASKVRLSFSLTIGLFFLQRFLAHFVMFWAVDKIFFLSKGITPWQISWLVALWSLYALIFEVPSGAVADRVSRKWLLVVAAVFHTLAYGVWLVSTGFWGFLLGYLFRGTGGFLDSGTKEAFLYDHLKAHGKSHEYEKFTGWLWGVTTLAFLLASVSGSFLAAQYSFVLILLCSLGANVFSVIVAIFFPEVRKSQSTEEISYGKFLWRTVKKSITHPLLFQALVYSMTVVAAYEVLDEYDQFFVAGIGFPLKWFGVWWALRMGSEMVAGITAHLFTRYDRDWLLLLGAGASLSLLSMLLFPLGLMRIGFFALFFYVSAVVKILNEGRMQHAIESHERATIASVNTLVVEVVAIILGLCYGFMAQYRGSTQAMSVFVICVSVFIIISLAQGVLRRLRLGAVDSK